ncbi:hypothetical protein M0802_012013 [Mischocyttarus mexicanus]|nr:hypothetical protein M0802_012013 [Mischocyttarus mexicanus]
MAGLCDDHAQFEFTVTKGYMVCALVGINAKLIVRGVPAARCTCSTADLCTLVVHYEVLVLFLEAILFFFVYY